MDDMVESSRMGMLLCTLPQCPSLSSFDLSSLLRWFLFSCSVAGGGGGEHIYINQRSIPKWGGTGEFVSSGENRREYDLYWSTNEKRCCMFVKDRMIQSVRRIAMVGAKAIWVRSIPDRAIDWPIRFVGWCCRCRKENKRLPSHLNTYQRGWLDGGLHEDKSSS